MEAIDLNDDGQNDVMDEDIEDHEVLEDSEANGGTQPRQVQSRRKVSRCWRKFTILGGRLSDGTTKIRCNLCRRFYFLNLRRNGTSTLTRHMKVCPKAVGTPRSSPKNVDMMVFREMIDMAIIEHDLPYKFWSRNTAASDVLKIYENEKQKLRKILNDFPSRVCLTTDLWRAITIEGYLCLTAHYIDEDWNLQAKILAFTAFPPPHSGIVIAVKLIELLKEWGLEKKVFCLTVDNASSNDSMQSIMKRQMHKDLVCGGEFFHVRCSAHILNLIVQDGLAVIGGALQKIRESVKFVRGSESREIMFQNCVETLGIEGDEGMVLDVSTRWNSTFLMLDRAIKFKQALGNLADAEASYVSFPSYSKWRREEMICELLRPFSEITDLISGSSYPTSNLYFNEVWKIECWLRAHANFSDPIICEMVKCMKLKFDKYWEEYSDILAIAAVFDPRLKFAYLEYCFSVLNQPSCKRRLAHVRSKIYKLFGAYKKNQRTSSAACSQVETQDVPAGYGVSSVLELFLISVITF
ncbi:zinc finger BED domain-containing protein RICESLEEPER 2-like [Brassica napus]|uniref:zinc finger BED domain-containing protein RICESLEEPER 2-like n=1 Tax=Brassica napus TaxID=3708 RepID=UPI002079CC1E|nr:zinc finger BED domain-containing protein RICESLEEPER 2-like [Brassica napus]